MNGIDDVVLALAIGALFFVAGCGIALLLAMLLMSGEE